MLKLLQTLIDNILLAVSHQHTFKLNSDEVLLHELLEDITAQKDSSAFPVLEEGCSTLCVTREPLAGLATESLSPQNDLPLIQSDLFVKEDCRLTDRQQEFACVPPGYIKALQTLIAL